MRYRPSSRRHLPGHVLLDRHEEHRGQDEQERPENAYRSESLGPYGHTACALEGVGQNRPENGT